MNNYKKIFAMKSHWEEVVKQHCPLIENTSGIYVFFRVDENRFKYCYCGQAKNLISRIAQHFTEFDHIGLSLKKHKLCNADNLFGWNINYIYCCESELDEMEREEIKEWHINKGYMLYNKTAGGQGEGKSGIAENSPRLGYYDGLKQGYINAQRDVSKLFSKNLTFGINGETNKNKEKSIERFKQFLKQ